MKTERYTFFTDYDNHLVLAENISVFRDKGQRHSLYQVPVSSVVNSESTFMLTKKRINGSHSLPKHTFKYKSSLLRYY